ncbi:hypothetical protein [Streptomyces sp. NPDC018833]|uniref:hypothetical protein n=1 Tax=Streptomyces sp. NPDC018833 TaxID=3365053 RepID=UPI0037883AD6
MLDMHRPGHRAMVETAEKDAPPMPGGNMQRQDTSLTDAQKRAFQQNEADFAKLEEQMRSVEEAATARLSASGLEFDEDRRNCYLCLCSGFESSGSSTRPSTRCANCPHQMTRHAGHQ